jgi:periplasmic copper chaperone A
MPGTHRALPWTASGPAPARRITRVLVAACLSALAAAGLAGCYGRASASPSIALATAYVAQPSVPGKTVGYLVIRNNGGRDRLISVRTSVGGKVTFRAPRRPGSTVMHNIPAIGIPAHDTLRLIPDGLHLLITGAGPMHGGKDIRLTLVFAHAGTVSVLAQVTNPQTGGSSYFLN